MCVMRSLSSAFLCADGLTTLQQLPKQSVDLILTDPPYIISRDSGMQALHAAGTIDVKYGKKYAIQTDYGEWDAKFTLEQLQGYIAEFFRVLRPGGTCIVFFDLWKLESLAASLTAAKFKQLRFIEWVKTNPVPINASATYLSNAREIAICAVKGGSSTFHSRYHNGIYQYPIYQGQRGIDRIHPTQKSLPLFQELIRVHSNPNDMVVDPFGGSGTTYLAAQLEHRQCLSTECDPEMHQRAMTRIAHYTPSMFAIS